ncbi:BolA family protein [Neokomagataea thailandica]|uniref:Stress response and cell division protein BolA n=1 Tax=Neokomagataea tanensis NBRC 106556 TaxID=1223519 RepID=A0ABQ0QKE6_9PROT|nr:MULTISPECIES: BolA family protein [Neokomagataea]GBR47968.1 stress response and cell division protein BolA [Neokomagataea tanensis NBRC 106556]
MTQNLSRRERIIAILTRELAPSVLDVQDDSARHAGHVGAKVLADSGVHGETHFNVAVTSAQFDGLNRVARHRLVQNLLSDEFETGLHALSLVLHGEQTS